MSSTKTGATPVAEETPAPGEVLGIANCKLILVKMRDGYGEELTKLVVLVAQGDAYFIDGPGVTFRPAQAWAKKAIIEFLETGK